MLTYSIEDLLYGTRYTSRNRLYSGTINYAEKRGNVWVDGGTAYAVRYRLDNSIVDKWATIVVANSENY